VGAPRAEAFDASAMDDMLMDEEYPEELMTEEEKEDWHHVSSGDMPSFYRECVQSFVLLFFLHFVVRALYRVRYHAFFSFFLLHFVSCIYCSVRLYCCVVV
jgi:hypothetical protein